MIPGRYKPHPPWIGIAMPFNHVPIAIERYETLYAGHDPMSIRESFKWHYQHFWGCDDGQADSGEYLADWWIAKGIDPLTAWEKVYDQASAVPAFIASREKVVAGYTQRQAEQ